MKIIDLSHSLSVDTPVYPGTPPPLLGDACRIERDGFAEKKLTFYSHTGTHIDAPAHIFQKGRSLDQIPVERFYGKGCSIPLVLTTGSFIEISDLEKYRSSLEKSEFVLFHTGWSCWWRMDKYFSGFPVLSVEAASWLSRFGLKGVGVDTISVDEVDNSELTVHRILLGNNILLIENLTCLDLLPPENFFFSCFPLKIETGDGSPVRAVAMIPD